MDAFCRSEAPWKATRSSRFFRTASSSKPTAPGSFSLCADALETLSLGRTQTPMSPFKAESHLFRRPGDSSGCGARSDGLVGRDPERGAAVDVLDQSVQTFDQSSYTRQTGVGGDLEGDDSVGGLEAVEKKTGRVELRDGKGAAPPLVD